MDCKSVTRYKNETLMWLSSIFYCQTSRFSRNIIQFRALNKYKLAAVNRFKNMSFAQMQNLTAGIFSQLIDFNKTSLCMKHGLDKDMKLKCENIPGLWPAFAGMLQFLPVSQDITNVSSKIRKQKIQML
jgi:hypothetical protein